MQVLPKRRRYSPLTSIENLEIRNLLSGIMSAAIPEAKSMTHWISPWTWDHPVLRQ